MGRQQTGCPLRLPLAISPGCVYYFIHISLKFVSRKISIELTSDKGDGTWTWRAAGAREPKGIVAATLLPQGAKVSSVFTAEIEMDLGELNVLSVTEDIDVRDSRPKAETIEVVGTKRLQPAVLTNFSQERGGGSAKKGGRSAKRGGGSAKKDGAAAKHGQPQGRHSGRNGSQNQRKRQRLNPGKQHQNNWLTNLPPEHAVIAERLVEGGIPAVKAALAKQNSQAGQPSNSHQPLLELAAELLAQYRSAVWHDRLDAVLKDFDKLGLGDIRAVVAASESFANSPETKNKADEAKQKLDQRVDVEHTQWLADLATHLSEGRLVRALKLSGIPPKIGVPLPEDLARWLADAAAESLSAHEPPERWIAVLEALAFSPVRRLVRPASIPSEVPVALQRKVSQLGARFPHIAELFVETNEISQVEPSKTPEQDQQAAPVTEPTKVPESESI